MMVTKCLATQVLAGRSLQKYMYQESLDQYASIALPMEPGLLDSHPLYQ